MSRSGRPPEEFAQSEWIRAVHWHRGDALHPHTYEKELTGCSAVVHCMGILLEANYKPLARFRGLQDFGAVAAALPLPSLVTQFLPFGNGQSRTDTSSSYEEVHCNSALTAADAAVRVGGVRTLVYISAHEQPPLVDSRYISSKRTAERALLDSHSRGDFRTVILRPGECPPAWRVPLCPLLTPPPAFMYDEERPVSMGIALVASLAHSALAPLTGSASPLRVLAEPLRADAVAEAVVQAVRNSDVQGVLDVPAIKQLSEQV